MDLTLDEAKAIINGTDSRSEAYGRNDPATMAAVEKAWQDAYPGERSLNEDFGLETQMAKAMEPQSPPAEKDGALPEKEPEGVGEAGQDWKWDPGNLGNVPEQDRRNLEVLRGEWGEEFDGNMNAVAAALNNKPQLLTVFKDEELKELGSDPVIMRALAKIGKILSFSK